MGALEAQLLLVGPLEEAHGAVDAGEEFAVEFGEGVTGAFDLFLGDLG